VDSLNTIHDNLLALGIIAAGVVLALHKDAAVGGTLITLGAAVFQRSASAPVEKKQ
jgi:hypothetical protein